VEVLEQGIGRLFTDPDADKAREFFRKKSRKMENKLMTLKDAIAKYVHDDDYLAIGGFGAIRTSVAACHEIMRQGRRNSPSAVILQHTIFRFCPRESALIDWILPT